MNLPTLHPLAPKELQKSKTPLIDELGTDLTELARNLKLDPVIGREDEMRRVIQILCRRTKNNPVLIGEPGVGKTAIVEKFAQNIAGSKRTRINNFKRVITLDIGSLVAGTKYRGEFEDRLKKIIKELKQLKNCIVFIDEIHTIVGAGQQKEQSMQLTYLNLSVSKRRITNNWRNNN